MSKNSSGLFKGTIGDRISSAIKPSVQRSSITSWAEKEASVLSATSKRQRDKFKTACVAVDEATGNMYFGRNGGIDRNGSVRNPTLFGDGKTKGILPEKPLNGYPTSWNCAESDAINNALNAGAKLENLHIYTIDTTPHNFGKNKASCINCTTAYKGRIKRNNTGWHKPKGD